MAVAVLILDTPHIESGADISLFVSSLGSSGSWTDCFVQNDIMQIKLANQIKTPDAGGPTFKDKLDKTSTIFVMLFSMFQ